jgi:Uma2 family endonuclease
MHCPALRFRKKDQGTISNPIKVFSYQDYLKLPEEPGYRYEVLEGMLVKDPSPNVIHQRVSRRLQRILEDYFLKVDSRGEIFDAPLDVTLGDITVVQPDLFYVSGEQKVIIKESRIDGPPTLIVEILSPSSGRKDRLQKMRIYQQAQVQHYWIVNPEEKTLECFCHPGWDIRFAYSRNGGRQCDTSGFCRIIYSLKRHFQRSRKILISGYHL